MLKVLEKRLGVPREEADIKAKAAQIEKQCTFIAFRQRHAFLTTLSVGCVLSAFAFLHLGTLVPLSFGADGAALGDFLDWLVSFLTKDLVKTDYAHSHVLAMSLFVLLLIAAYLIHKKAKNLYGQYLEIHPYFGKRSSKALVERYKKRARHFTVAGVVVLLVFVACSLFAHTLKPTESLDNLLFSEKGSVAYELFDGLSLLFLAMAVMLLKYGACLRVLPSYEDYDLGALSHRSLYSVARGEDDVLRSAMVVAKRTLMQAATVCHLVLALAIIASAALLFLPSFETPYWWIPVLVGFLVCDLIKSAAVRAIHHRLGDFLVIER